MRNVAVLSMIAGLLVAAATGSCTTGHTVEPVGGSNYFWCRAGVMMRGIGAGSNLGLEATGAVISQLACARGW